LVQVPDNLKTRVNKILDGMTKNWTRVFLELGLLAILLAILIHYAGNIILIYNYEEVVIYEPNKIILTLEFSLDIIVMIYVIYRLVKIAKV